MREQITKISVLEASKRIGVSKTTVRALIERAEIGEKLGITAHKVGSIANKHNLKTEEYGLMVWDKSQYSSKQVETWRYYENVIPVIKQLIEEQKGA